MWSVGRQVDFEFCCGPADLQTQGREYAGVRSRRHVPCLGFISKHLGRSLHRPCGFSFGHIGFFVHASGWSVLVFVKGYTIH